MAQKIKMSRHQIEQIAVCLQLNQNVDYVTIIQCHSSGLGASHMAVYHNRNSEIADIEDDISDVSNW